MSVKIRKPFKYLTLAEKKQVIERSEAGESGRKLGRSFDVNKGAIANILKNREAILNEYKQNINPDRKRSLQSTKNDELNSKVYELFTVCRSKDIPVTGPQLQKKARIIAKSLNINDFKASNGWLDKFRVRYNIQFKARSKRNSQTSSNCSKYVRELTEFGTLMREELFNDEADREVPSSEDYGETIEQITENIIEALNEDDDISEIQDELEETIAEKVPAINSHVALVHLKELTDYCSEKAPDGFYYLQKVKTEIEKLSNNPINDSDEHKVSNPFTAKTDENPAQIEVQIKKIGTMFKIGDYLRDYKKQNDMGTCKACEKSVRWSSKRLGSHKRATCVKATSEEKEFFRSQIIPKKSKVSKLSGSTDICKTRESTRLSSKCFSCNSLLGSCSIPLKITTEVSESSLAEIIETTTGLEISEKAKSEEALCNRCYLLVENLVDLKARSKIIEKKLVEMLKQKQTEYVYIKEEPEEYFEINCSDNSDESELNGNSENDDDDEWFDESIAKRPKIDKKISSATIRQHEKPQSFLCGQCGALFSRQHSFKLHMMIHDDTRPFKCTFPDCLSRFLNSEELERHLPVHAGEKIFECPQCPVKRFAQKRGMDLHIENYHSTHIEKREVCKICGTRIPTSEMKLHLNQKHDVILES